MYSSSRICQLRINGVIKTPLFEDLFRLSLGHTWVEITHELTLPRDTKSSGTARLRSARCRERSRRNMTEINLTFSEITEADVSELTGVMTRACDDDARKHFGKERGGPPVYDTGEFIRDWLFGYEWTAGYKATMGDFRHWAQHPWDDIRRS